MNIFDVYSVYAHNDKIYDIFLYAKKQYENVRLCGNIIRKGCVNLGSKEKSICKDKSDP